MWFNEEIKQQFIDTLDLTQYPNRYWDNLFNALAPHEELLEKDLYNFTKKQIVTTYKMLNYVSYETLMVAHINLKKYILWALSQNLVLDGQDHFEEISNTELFGCVNQLQLQQSIVTREDVVSSVRRLENYQDRFIILGLFEGIKGDKFSDLTMAKMSDIDQSNLTMKLNSGRAISISPDLLNMAENASVQTSYYVTGKDSITREQKIYGDGIIKVLQYRYDRGFTQANERQVYHVLMKSIDDFGWSGRVSTTSLHTSGMIHMVNQLAEEYGVTGEEALYNIEILQRVKQQYGFNQALRKRFIMKYKVFLH